MEALSIPNSCSENRHVRPPRRSTSVPRPPPALRQRVHPQGICGQGPRGKQSARRSCTCLLTGRIAARTACVCRTRRRGVLSHRTSAMATTTLTEADAARLSRAVVDALNSKDAAIVLPLLDAHAVWRAGDAVYRGRRDIWSALQSRWANTLHFQARQGLLSHDGHQITARFEAEWQDARHGGWFRCSGQVAFTIDAGHRITRIESHTELEPISADTRRLRIVTPSARP